MSDVVNIDYDCLTGLPLIGWPAVAQSIREIFLTNFGQRVMREWFGSFVPQALGRNISPETMLALSTSIAASIDLFEPRYAVTRIAPVAADRMGNLALEIEGEYRPRALLGDESAQSVRTVTVSFGDGVTRVIG